MRLVTLLKPVLIYHSENPTVLENYPQSACCGDYSYKLFRLRPSSFIYVLVKALRITLSQKFSPPKALPPCPLYFFLATVYRVPTY